MTKKGKVRVVFDITPAYYYHCNKCHRVHNADSKIGMQHRQYAG